MNNMVYLSCGTPVTPRWHAVFGAEHRGSRTAAVSPQTTLNAEMQGAFIKGENKIKTCLQKGQINMYSRSTVQQRAKVCIPAYISREHHF